jgi:alanine-glyoxylate transaminase/serine-glyoxylate transaminase/serine-pyruvate transaminase
VNGKVFRIGHLGNMDELMLCSALAGAEMAMIDAGESLACDVSCAVLRCVGQHVVSVACAETGTHSAGGVGERLAGAV